MKKIKLSNEVIVSDPCYEVPTWCQIIVRDVLPGEYVSEITRVDLDGWGNRVSTLSCVHKDYIERQLELSWVEHSGTIGVDSGQAGIFSMESYRKDKYVEDLPKYDFGGMFPLTNEEGEQWYGHCCHLTLGNESWGVYDEGVVSESGVGDGSYPLFVLMDGEKTVGFLIDFYLED